MSSRKRTSPLKSNRAIDRKIAQVKRKHARQLVKLLKRFQKKWKALRLRRGIKGKDNVDENGIFIWDKLFRYDGPYLISPDGNERYDIKISNGLRKADIQIKANGVVKVKRYGERQ